MQQIQGILYIHDHGDTILETHDGSVYWKDRNGAYLGANERMPQLCEIGSNQVIGKSHNDLIWPSHAAAFTQIDQDIIQAKRAKKTWYFWILLYRQC